jgi:hypothetical protein
MHDINASESSVVPRWLLVDSREMRNMQATLQREGLSVSAVELDSAALATPSFASQLCLLQAKGYCTGDACALHRTQATSGAHMGYRSPDYCCCSAAYPALMLSVAS